MCDEKKSVDTLVRAWARRDPDRTPPLVLAGKSAGGETQYLRDLAVDLGADPDRMHFVGYVPDEMVRAVYAEAEAKAEAKTEAEAEAEAAECGFFDRRRRR